MTTEEKIEIALYMVLLIGLAIVAAYVLGYSWQIINILRDILGK